MVELSDYVKSLKGEERARYMAKIADLGEVSYFSGFLPIKAHTSSEKATNLIKSGHVVSVKEEQWCNVILIKGRVIRQTKVNEAPVCVEIAITKTREKAEVKCYFDVPFSECNPLISPCLFNIDEDPCEFENVAKDYSKKVEELLNRLSEYNATAVPPGNLPIDPKGNPKFWNNIWTNFGDYETNAIY